MGRMTAGCLAVTIILALPPLSPAATIIVDPAGGGDFTRIQEALDAAADGDRVLVRPGEYLLSEPLDFNRNSDPSSGDGKNLVLQSENGPAVTTLRMTRMDGSSSDRAIVVFHRGETRASALIGFTLTGGGHAIRLWGESNPVIRDCIITHNATDDPAHEGAIQTDFEGYPHLVEDCVIIDNDATGVVFPVDGVPVILLKRCLIARNSPHGVIGANATDCEIADNGGVGISGSALGCRITGNSTGVGIRYEGTISITDSLITRNRAWGVSGFFADAIVTNSVILENGGGGISVIHGGGVHAVNSAIVGNGGHGVEVEVFFPQAALLESCIIWGNAGQSVAQFTPEGGDPSHQAPPTILYCDTAEPEPGVGNISADPLFCDSADGNSLALSDGSPCLGTGAGGVDMGASTGTCDGLIVDDGALGTQAVGNWYVSGAPSPYGSESVYARDAGAIYNYRLLVPAAGEYDLYLWWTVWPSRIAAVPVEVDHASGTDTVHIDQTKNGGQWNKIGRWKLDGIARIRILSLGPGSTCADAVKIAPAGAVDTTVILDNGQPGTSSTGSWPLSGGSSPYGATSLYSKQAGATYRFAPVLPRAGSYRVSLWWSAFASRPDDVRVDIGHAGGTSTIHVNQRLGGGAWNDAGVYAFADSALITIVSGGNGSTCADAIKLEPAVPPPFEKIIDNGTAGTSSSGTWPVSGGANPYGTSSLYSKQSGATYSFAFTVPAPGSYEVFLWWTEYPSRLTSVPVDIVKDGAATETRLVNQQQGGGTWNSLGTFAATGPLTVRIRSPGGGTTCADAARIVQAP